MVRIICIGNRFMRKDAAGPRVYDRLGGMKLPPEIMLIDGGLGGLNLLPFFDAADKVILVDQVAGPCDAPGVVHLKPSDVAVDETAGYDHTSGLGYLLAVLPQVCEQRVPEIDIVGVSGDADDKTIEEAARLALKLALPARCQKVV